MSDTPIRSILVCGGGTAGWMCAAALARFLPREIGITLIHSTAIGTVGVGEATIPPIVQFNTMLGIDEDRFLAATNATFKLGIEFQDWLETGHRYMHPFGPFGADMHEISFHHYWRRAVSLGMGDALIAFNAEEQAAYAPGPGRPRAPLNYAYHFDAAAYGAFLQARAEADGVTTIDGKIAEIELAEDGAIASVRLDDGRRIDADFFIDCTGFRSLLVGEALGVPYEDWSRYLPNNRAMAMPSAAILPDNRYTRSIAQPWGWRWQIPLQHRTGNGIVYCDGFVDDDTVEATLRRDANIADDQAANRLRFQAGRRREPWKRNCLAVGLASGFLEPLESTSIHLVQAAILSFLTHFPEGASDDVMASRYNAAMNRLIEGTRDFIVAHYKCTRRDDSAYWKHCAAMEIPDSLAGALDLFRSRGEVLAAPGDLFKEASWFAVLNGQGLRSAHWHPAADRMPAGELRLNMDRIAALVMQRARAGLGR